VKTIIVAVLALAAVPVGAQSMLTLHESQAGAICYRAPLGGVSPVARPALAASGYGWSRRGGEAFEQVGEPVIGIPAGGRMVAGGPQIQTLRFRAVRAGRNDLTVVLARPSEGGAPIRTLVFCLTTPAR
jgi:hypothetical protein